MKTIFSRLLSEFRICVDNQLLKFFKLLLEFLQNARANLAGEPYVMVGDMHHILDSLNLARHLFQRSGVFFNSHAVHTFE